MAAEPKTRLLNRTLTTTGRIIVTLAFTFVALTAVIFGQSFLADRAAAIPPPLGAEPLPVNVQNVAHENSYLTERLFLGQVEPASTVDLSFELSGLITELHVSEGSAVQKGDLLARLDTTLLETEKTRLQALRSATKAQLVFAQTRLDRAINLQKEGFTSVETRDRALALRDELANRIAETDAALRAVEINLSKSVLSSPISGRVAAQTSDASETISPGQPILTIMETSAPEFRVGLPLDLDPELFTSATIQIAEATYSAELLQIRPDIDSVTRTRTVLFRLPENAPFLFGQTATLRIEIETKATGFWVALDALKQGDGRVWTVLTVDDTNTVRRAAVEIVHAEHDRAYVSGSVKDGDLLIETGAHRVVPGQKVQIANDGA